MEFVSYWFFIPGAQSKKQESIHTGQLLYFAKGDKISNTRRRVLLAGAEQCQIVTFVLRVLVVQKQLTLSLLTALLLCHNLSVTKEFSLRLFALMATSRVCTEHKH